jgi:hypothetical protein
MTAKGTLFEFHNYKSMENPIIIVNSISRLKNYNAKNPEPILTDILISKNFKLVDRNTSLARILSITNYFEKYKLQIIKKIIEQGFHSIIVPFGLQDTAGKSTKKVFFCYCSKCHRYFARFNRKSIYCYSCRKSYQKIHRIENQKIRRWVAKGISPRYCQNPSCNKVLPQKYPNKKYCNNLCSQAAYRIRKKGA